MIEETDIAIVGAGPAGLAAAGEAARTGARVVVLDDNAQPGGQYLRHPPHTFERNGITYLDKELTRLDELLAGLNRQNVRLMAGATVWDQPEPLTLAIAAGDRSGRIRARAIVLATGARDRAVPFPGWTLPGVISAGGVQNLVKGMRIAPPGPAVVAGNGPLLFVVSASLLRAGIEVAAVIEAARISKRLILQSARLVAAPSILRLAGEYRLELLRARVPILYGHTITRAEGEPDLSHIECAEIDADGKLAERRVRIAARTLVTGFGLTPSLELARLMGAREITRPLGAGSGLERNERLETSVAGVFAAGDGVAIGGIEMALVEGRIAGIEAAVHAGSAERAGELPRLMGLNARLARLNRFRDGLERVFAPPASWTGLITPDTIVCRCEDVTRAELERRRGEGAATATQLKPPTRVGMGRCQGRNCMGTLAALIAEADGVTPADVPLPRPRPPVRPIPLADMLHETIPPPDIPDDPHLPRKQ